MVTTQPARPTEQRQAGRVLWPAFCVLFTVAAILGAWGLAQLSRSADQCPPPASAPCGYTAADVVYFDAQLFLLGAEPLQNGGPFPLPLEFARFLAPLATAYGVAVSVWNLLTDRRHRWMARRARDHAVVIGDDLFAMTLVRRLRAAGVQVVVISADPDLDRAEGLVQSAALVVIGDAWDQAVLRAAGVPRAATVYACLPDSAATAATVAAVGALAEQEPDRDEPLACYARLADGELALALKARRVGLSSASKFRLDFFTPEELAARTLAARILEPHLGSDDPVPSIAVVGLGPFGRALVVELARLWRVRAGGPPLPLVLIDTNASSQLTELRQRYRPVDAHCAPRAKDEAAQSFDLATIPWEILIPATVDTPEIPAIRHLVLCDQDEDAALRRGLNMVRGAAGTGQTVTVCVGQRTALGDLLNPHLLDPGPGEVRVFAVMGEAAEPGELHNDTLTALARAIHGQYLVDEQEKGATIGGTDSMQPWETLRADLRAANRSQAEGIGAKLNAVNAVVIPMTHPMTDFAFTAAETDMLARFEHERWCAERRRAGWTFAPVRDDSRKQHNLLRDWTDLSPDQRAKATATVRHLPGLLVDHGLQILRLH
ncbi:MULTISPECIES: NAD-binding protein [unclassified Frankia]|uniref:NAD-binding protein n=1 Tax=unclassified Frankia TaxID=2632575 RepID=UPI002AD222DA|nr:MULTISPECIES: NAD-binding protein [unclassified Frankia]